MLQLSFSAQLHVAPWGITSRPRPTTLEGASAPRSSKRFGVWPLTRLRRSQLAQADGARSVDLPKQQGAPAYPPFPQHRYGQSSHGSRFCTCSEDLHTRAHQRALAISRESCWLLVTSRSSASQDLVLRSKFAPDSIASNAVYMSEATFKGVRTCLLGHNRVSAKS